MMMKMFRFKKDDFITIFCLQGGFSIFSVMMLFFVEAVLKENDGIFMLGTCLNMMIMLFICFFMGCSVFRRDYNIAVTMGTTRKEFFISFYICTLISVIIQAAFVYAFYWIEKQEIRLFYSYLTVERGPEIILFTVYVIPVLILLSALTMLMGTLVLRFGKKVYVIFWIIWMLMCFIPGKIGNVIENGIENASAFVKVCIDIFNYIVNLPQIINIIVILCISIINIIISALLIKKQAVN